MADYKYNGVKLPKLPEYDTAVYPYSYIFDYADLHGYVLVISTTRFTLYEYEGYSDKVIGDESGTSDAVVYTVTDGAWTELDIDAQNGAWWGTAGSALPCVWCNTDILDSEDGSVYLAASEPVKAFCLRSWLTGFALGLAGKPLPLAVAKKLVGYSYNGVVLPKLPEWDKETYPCAYIVENGYADTEGYEYGLVFYTKAITVVKDAEGPHEGWHYFFDGLLYRYIDNAWTEWPEDVGFGLGGKIVWSNTDVYYGSGGLYLATSEPVPVYV